MLFYISNVSLKNFLGAIVIIIACWSVVPANPHLARVAVAKLLSISEKTRIYDLVGH